LLQPLPCNKNRSYCFHIEQLQYFIYVLWQNDISASIYLHRHWCLIFWFYLSLSSKSNFNENWTYQEKHIIFNDQYVVYIKYWKYVSALPLTFL
jgi:hypothetical protein